MTSTFLAEANKLRNIQVTLQKNEQVLLDYLKKNGDVQVVEFYEELQASRKKEMEVTWMEYKNIVGPLNKFKSLISKDPLDIIADLNQIKKEMFTLEKNIKTSKSKTRECLEKLQGEEKGLIEEVKLYEQKIGYWGRHVNIADTVYDKNIKNNVDQNVTDFLAFLSKNGGHTNGWSSEDHHLFLKARKKCRDLRELCKYMHALLPDISQEEIEAHDKWYENYLELKRKHKEAIKSWRQVKSATLPNKIRNNNSKSNGEETRIKSAYTIDKFYKKEDIQKKLQQWKIEKEEKLQTENIIRSEMQKRQYELEEKRREKQEEMKRTVQTWKMERLEKEQLKNLEKLEADRQQKEFKAAMANRLIKEFQSQDDLFIKKRKELCRPKTKSFERLPVCNINVPRDPSRLLKPTKQWIARLKADDHQKTDRPNNLKSIPKLAIPEWRKNLVA